MFEQPVHLIQPTFSRGEVSPQLFGRVDLAGWSQGLRTLRNYRVRPEGSVSNREGLSFVGNAVSVTPKSTVLLPFVFSATQSYVIEVGNGTAQVFSQGGIVLSATAATITAATFVVISGTTYIQFTTSGAHGFSVNQNIGITGVVGTGAFLLINTGTQVSSVPSPTTFQVASPQPSGNYVSGGSAALAASFSTPWSQSALAGLRYAQSSDTLTVVHPSYPPYEIKRTSGNTFTCLPGSYANGPFLQQNSDGVTFVYASAKSGTVTLTSTAPIFQASHVGALFQMTQQDLSVITPWEPVKQFSGTSIVGQFRRASLKNYLAVSLVSTSPGSFNATGTQIPSHSQGVAADGDGQTVVSIGTSGVNWLYQDSGFGVVLITGFTDSQHVTGLVQPNYTGGPGLLPISCVGGPQAVAGPFDFSGNGATTSFSLGSNTSADPSKFYVLVNGSYISPSLYTISGAPGNIVFYTAPPTGTNNVVVTQISGLGQTTYWAFGAFSPNQGYPSAVSYFPDRLILAATPQQPVGVFGSRTSLYHDFGVSNPVVASDSFSVFLNARELNAISDLIPLSDLLIGTSKIIWRLWPGQTGVALSPLAIASTPQSYYGQSPNCAALLFGDSGIFPEYDGRRLRDLLYQFAFDKFLGQELTLYSRHLIPYGTYFKRLAYKPDSQAQLVFGLRSDGLLLCCTYLREQQIIGWSWWDTQGTFEDICVVPETLPNGTLGYSLYAILNRTINGSTARYIERLNQREVSTIYDYKFVDCGLTYDGRNTSGVAMKLTGGTTWLAGDTGTLTASASAGWVGFQITDPSFNNEIWLYQTLTFTSSVVGAQSGTLITAVTPGVYIVTFPTGETRSITVNPDGLTCSWIGILGPLTGKGPMLTGTLRCRLLITGYTNPTNVTVRLKDPCPTNLQAISTTAWTFARTTFTGASQLTNTPVVAFVDACVLGINSAGSAPNGSLTVSSTGVLTLPVAGGVVQAGLPYLADFETLPLNAPGQETIRMRAKTEPIIYLDVTEARNFLAGTDFSAQNLEPHAERAFEPWGVPTALQEGVQWIRVPVTLTAEAHSCIRQNMPLPISIRGVIPAVQVGEPIS